MKNFDFAEVVEEMKSYNMPTGAKPLRIQVPDAKIWLKKAIDFFIRQEGNVPKWLNAYDEVAEWLSDNKGKGLFMYGNVGQGKSVLGRLVIPAILLKTKRKVVFTYDTDQMNANIDKIKQQRFVSLDDIGTETIINDYGNKRSAFSEIMDNAEKTGNLLIVSTNLSKEQIIEKYGDRVFDRIKSTTKRVLFTGKSMRR